MASSISKAQAKALADGFLDTLGTKRDGLRVENTTSELILLAGELVEQAQKNLVTTDRVASGALSESLKVLNPEFHNRNIQVDVEALLYYQFIDSGVRGTRGGTSGKGYSFKNEVVGRKMRDAIRKWLIREGLKARSDKYTVTNRETRRKSISETSNQVAYAIARSIKQKGLKRTNFFAKAIRSTKVHAKENLARGFKIDIINAIPKQLNAA